MFLKEPLLRSVSITETLKCSEWKQAEKLKSRESQKMMMLVSDVVYVVVVCDVVCDDIDGDEGSCKVEWLILCCFGVLLTDERTNGRTDIGGCRVPFATENKPKMAYSHDAFTRD